MSAQLVSELLEQGGDLLRRARSAVDLKIRPLENPWCMMTGKPGVVDGFGADADDAPTDGLKPRSEGWVDPLDFVDGDNPPAGTEDVVE